MKLTDQKLQLDLIRAYWQRADDNWHYPAYRRPYNWLIHTLSGRGRVELSDRSIALEPHSLVVIPLNQLCHYRCSEPMHLGASAFTLTLDSGLDLFELYRPPSAPIPLKDSSAIAAIIEAQDSPQSHFQALSAMYQLLAPLIEAAEPNPVLDANYQRLDKVLKHIDKHLSENLSVPDLAAIHGTSTAHFSRWFSAAVGTAPKQFIVDKRIDKASKMLLLSNLKVEQIAYRVGFDDPLYFSKCFKKITGMTPSAYRKTRRYDVTPPVQPEV